jgi:hypothetical protein
MPLRQVNRHCAFLVGTQRIAPSALSLAAIILASACHLQHHALCSEEGLEFSPLARMRPTVQLRNCLRHPVNIVFLQMLLCMI